MTTTAKQLRRIFFLLKILSDELEYLALDAHPGLKKKIENVYLKRGVSFVLRDLLTSTQSQETYDAMFRELNSEHTKDVGAAFDFIIECANITEVIEVLYKCVAEDKEIVNQ